MCMPTLCSVLGPVSELSYKVKTSTSVNITWKPPKEPNGVIVSYFVEHRVYQNESTTSVEVTDKQVERVIQYLSKLLLYIILWCIYALSISVMQCMCSQSTYILQRPPMHMSHIFTFTSTCTNLCCNCGSDATVPHHISHT